MSSGKTIAILQLSYIPWKGYFDLMAAVNEFLIFDEVQYTKRDWRNRNRIVSNGTVSWLKIPVATAGHWKAPIDSIEIADPQWAARHWARVDMSYRHANYSGYPEYDQGPKSSTTIRACSTRSSIAAPPRANTSSRSETDRHSSIPAEAQHRAYVFDPMARDCSALGGVDLIGGRVGDDDRVHADSLLPGAVDCSKHFEPTAAMVFCRTRKAEAR